MQQAGSSESTHDGGDVAIRNAVKNGYVSVAATIAGEGTNRANFVVRQLEISGVSALLDHVGDVVRVGPEKEVGRIAARRIVAAVADEQTIWDLSVGDFPDHSVRPTASATPACSAPDCEEAVALRATRGQPRPALIGTATLNLGPESFFEGKLQISHSILRDRVVRGRSGADTLAGPVYFTSFRCLFASGVPC